MGVKVITSIALAAAIICGSADTVAHATESPVSIEAPKAKVKALVLKRETVANLRTTTHGAPRPQDGTGGCDVCFTKSTHYP